MSNLLTCPHCRITLRVSDYHMTHASACPHCLQQIEPLYPTELPAPKTDGEAPKVLRDIRRDSSATRWMLGLLIGLGIVGVVLVIFNLYAGSSEETKSGLFTSAAGLMISAVFQLLLFGPIIVAALLWRFFGRGHRVLGFLALACGLGFAIIIFLFILCAEV